MVIFEDREDVRDWLKPMDYIAFWKAVAPYDLTLQDRDHCDGLIASGTVEQDLVLSGLKSMAVQELSRKLGLKSRMPNIERSMKVH
ncbi:MAG: hypothetical protein AAFO77_02285 [Pseudomonadota bacterium]